MFGLTYSLPIDGIDEKIENVQITCLELQKLYKHAIDIENLKLHFKTILA